MALRLITAASSPVTLAEAKAHVYVTHANDDALIQLYIDAATANLDGRDGILGRALGTQTWELVMDSFPVGPIQFPLPPLQSITSVKYFNVAGLEVTLGAAQYNVDAASEPGWVSPVSSWPATFPTINAVSIRFVAGYTQVPAAIKAAILLMAGDLYAIREANVVGTIVAVNPTVMALTYPYRMISV